MKRKNTYDHFFKYQEITDLLNGYAKDFPRKKIDKLGDFAKTYHAKGLAWARLHEGNMTSSYAKFLTEEENAAILEQFKGMDLHDILLVSECEIGEGKPASANVSTFNGLTVEVSEAPGPKCPRCWMHSVDADAETGLCPRCASVVAKL